MIAYLSTLVINTSKEMNKKIIHVLSNGGSFSQELSQLIQMSLFHLLMLGKIPENIQHNLIHALLLTIPTILLFDFESSHSLVHCFGLEEEIAQRYNSSSAKVERMFMCKLRSGNDDDGEAGISYLLIQSFCGMKMVYTTFVMSNIWEGFFYYMVFKKMKRYDYKLLSRV